MFFLRFQAFECDVFFKQRDDTINSTDAIDWFSISNYFKPCTNPGYFM